MTQETGHSFILCSSRYLTDHYLSREAMHDIVLIHIVHPLTDCFAFMYLQVALFFFFLFSHCKFYWSLYDIYVSEV